MTRKLLVASMIVAAALAAFAWASCSKQQAATAMKQEDRLTLAQDLAQRGKCSKAILEYEKLLSEFPKPQVAETAKFNLARCRFDIGEYDQAVADFEDFINTYPKSDLVDNAMYQIGLCYLKQAPRPERDQAKTKQALDELTLLVRKYPTTDVKADVDRAIGEAKSRLAEKEIENGRLYLRLADYKSARIYFDYVVSTYSDTPWAPEALFSKGQAFEREGDPAQARIAYQQVIDDYPSSPASAEAARRLKELGGGSNAKGEATSQH
ncbi:MAG TPA: outer membrane protein assembly factor BamD [bacterium]|nr:outer membrane protein assembly factor BamD [bacterium]